MPPLNSNVTGASQFNAHAVRPDQKSQAPNSPSTFSTLTTFVLLILFSSLSFAKGVSPESVSGAKTITPTEAKQLWRQGVKFIDTRKSSDWEAGRIPGALHINIKTEFDKKNLLKHVDLNEPVVTYCNAIKCLRAANAAKKLVDYGYQKVYYYRLGFPSWKNAGYPYE